MTKDRVRRGRFRIAKWALVGGVALLAGAIAIALALAQLRPTQMAGRIAVTADRFVDLGGGLTLATGNIQLGDKLEMAGEDAQVLFNSHTLTGRGTLVMAEDNTPLLSGEFNADVASGVATPASGASSKLARVAGFAVSKPAEIEKIDIPNGTATGIAVIHIAGPSQVATSTVNFMLSPELLFSGVLPPLDFELGGVRLQAPGGAALANGMISIPQVSVTFPPEYGGGTATINDFRVAADGVSVAGADGTFEAPEMIWGENSEFRLMNAKGRFVYDGTVFSILTDLSGDLAINVPGLAENVKASVALSTIDGQVALVGKTEPLNLMLGGVALQTGPLALVAEGLSTANATLVFPPEMSGMSVAVSDVMITAEGLSVGGGSFALPEIQLADGMLTLSGAKAQVTPVDGVYMVAAEGTLNMMLPGAQEPATVSFMVDSNGALQGVAKGIKIDLGGPQIVLGEAQIGANGLTASGAMFVLPPELGGISGMVDVVNITAEGLDFGAAGLNLLLPDLPMGEAMTAMGGR